MTACLTITATLPWGLPAPVIAAAPPAPKRRAPRQPRSRDVLTCHEADQRFRKAHGFFAALWRSGGIRGRKVGNAIEISRRHAEDLFGLDGLTADAERQQRADRTRRAAG